MIGVEISETGLPPPIFARRRGLIFVKKGVAKLFRRHQLFLAITSVLLVLRFFLSNRNSYWLDEILSIWIYGAVNPDFQTAIVRLAGSSIHPPLYQSVLYVWMEVFGHSETATRTLSNIFVSLASLFLYLFLTMGWSRYLAAFASGLFNISFPAIFYGMESRSYALTMFLVALSSYLFLRLLLHAREGRDWRSASGFFVMGAAANALILLTHYYNFFWVVAQSIFLVAIAFSMLKHNRFLWATRLSLSAGLIPAIVFALIWGRIFIEQFRLRSGSYGADQGLERNLYEMVRDLVVFTNLPPILQDFMIATETNGRSGLLGGILVTVVLGAALLVFVKIFKNFSDAQQLIVVNLFFWLVGPTIATWLGFSLLGVERYKARYFLHSVMPFFPLLVVFTHGILAGWKSRNSFWNGAKLLLAIATTLLVALTAVSNGYQGAIRNKHDWRGITQSVVDSTRNLDREDFVLIAVSNGSSGVRENYYFQRFTGSVGLDLALPRSDAASGEFEAVEEVLSALSGGTKVYFLFLHNREKDYQELLNHIEKDAVLSHQQLDRLGRGFVVFQVQGD